MEIVDKIKINKEDFTFTTDYVWSMEAVVLFRTTKEGCDLCIRLKFKSWPPFFCFYKIYRPFIGPSF